MSLIKLEIAMDYPIKWEFGTVFRDIVQNFYDSLLPEEFDKKLSYSYELEENGYHVVLETKGTEFNYEWLRYVGGSTKTDQPKSYVGKYGEGFKMVALRIMQMGGMTMYMHSQNWLISPTEYTETIDNRNIPMLGYDYKEVEADGITRLELFGVDKKYKSVLENALLDFCYPENALFGPLVGRGEDWELYERSKKPIPSRDYSPELKGILYINNLARGRLDIPVIINLKAELTSDTRSRETLKENDTVDYLHCAVEKMDAKSSMYLLELLRGKWNEYPKNRYDINTKYYLVCQLVRNIAADEETKTEFEKSYKNLAYIERKGADSIRNKLIEETTVWAKENNTKTQVNGIFRLLGAQSLVEAYLANKNKAYILPTELEKKRAELLYEAAQRIVQIKLTDEMPDIIIDEKEGSANNPLQFATQSYVKLKGQINKKYKINKMALKHEDFLDEAYHSSLVKMCEGLLHEYGSDKSRTLTVLLTKLAGWMLNDNNVINEYYVKWLEAGTTLL